MCKKSFHQQMPMEEIDINDDETLWVLPIPRQYIEWLAQFDMEPGNVDLEFSLDAKAPLVARPKSQRYNGDPFMLEEAMERMEA